MTPLLLGAAWLLFVISCVASMMPAENRMSVKSKSGGKNGKAT